jgi:biotin operon repressor
MNMMELNSKQQKILLVLAHLAPTAVSGYQLSLLLGYSRTSRSIYKGILNDLQQEGYINIHKGPSKQNLIRISRQHPQMAKLIDLVSFNGKQFRDEIYNSLEIRLG